MQIRIRENRKVFYTKSRTGAEWEIPEKVRCKSLIIDDFHVKCPGTPMLDWTVGTNGKRFHFEGKGAKMA